MKKKVSGNANQLPKNSKRQQRSEKSVYDRLEPRNLLANTPPTLDPISDLSIDEDAFQQIVNLSGISAGDGETQAIRITATSSNPTLVPNPIANYDSPNPTGMLTFTPIADRSGSALVTVTVEDAGIDGDFNTPGDNATFAQSFNVLVNPINDLPTLDPLSDLTINEDAPRQTVNLTGVTAGGGESQPLRITATSSNPALIPDPVINYTSDNQTGTLSFKPNLNQSGVTIITVTVEDGGLDEDINTQGDNATFSLSFQVNVNPVNDAPTLDPISDMTLNEDAPEQTVNLSGITAGGGESQPLRVTASSSNTTLIPNLQVNYVPDDSTGTLTFTPAPNLSGTSTITVTVEDGGLDGNLNTPADNLISTRSFIVRVNSDNDAPTLDPIADMTLNEDDGVQTVSLSGITPGSGESQPMKVTAISSNSALIHDPIVNYSSPDQTGSIVFTPAANQFGVAFITVTVEDGGEDGDLNTPADNATFSRVFKVTVNPINDLPTLSPISDMILNEDAPQQTVALSGITAGGKEDQPLRVTAISSVPSLIPTPSVNYVSANSNGSISFTPAANQSGVAVITVTVEDGGIDGDLNTPADNLTVSRSFQVTVNSLNDVPTLDPLPDMSIDEDAPQTVNLTGISAGGGESQPVRVTATSNNTGLIPNPTVNYNNPNTTGSLNFTPAANQSGVAIITVRVEDGGNDGDLNTPADNLSFTRSFQVTVNSVNDEPTLNPINDLNINEDAPLQTVNLAGITAGGGEVQPLKVTAISSNTALIPTPVVSYTSPNTSGTLNFTPIANQSGVATITVTVEDGGPDGDLNTPADNASFSRSFQVTVNAVNDQPTLNPINDLTIDEDAPMQTVGLSGISAGGGESQPLRVTATSSNTSLIPNPTANYSSPNQTGSISFTPVGNQSGVATITVTVEDGGLDGNLNTTADNATFSRSFQVTVNAVNDLPTLDPISNLTISEDAAQQVVNLSGITAGGGESQPLKVTAVSDNTNLIPNPTVSYNSPSQTGAISFTPVANQSGAAIITVTVEDGGLDGNLNTSLDNLSFSRSFLVTVNPVNDTPTLLPIGDLLIDEDAPQQTVNLAGITAGGGETQPLRVTATSSNPGLIPNPSINYTTANSTGSLRFTPLLNQYGDTTITVTVEDGGLDGNLNTTGDNATFSRSFDVTVRPVNEPPTLDPIADLTLQEDSLEAFIDLLGITAGGIKSQPLKVTAFSGNTALLPHPQVNYQSANSSGSLRVAPIAQKFGTATVTVTVEDGGMDQDLSTAGDNASFSRSFEVIVTPVNDPPTLDPLSDVTVDENAGTQNVNLTGITAGTGESQPLRVTAISSNPGLIPNPIVNYDSANQIGMLSFTPVAFQSGKAIITVTVEDGGVDGNLDTTVDNLTVSRSFEVTVNPVNQTPTLGIIENITLLEDAGPQTVNLSGITAGGGESQPLRVTAFSSNVDLIPTVNVNYVSPDEVGFLGFTPQPNQYGVATITVTVEDGGLDGNLATASDNASITRTFTVTVNSVNDSPRIENFGGDISFNENGPAVRISPAARVIDLDTVDFAGGRLTVTFVSGNQPNDELIVQSTGFLTVSGKDLFFSGQSIGTWAGGTAGSPLEIDFVGGATLNRVQHILQNIAFGNSSDAPGSAVRRVVVELTDGAGGSTADNFQPTKQIFVNDFNDAPSLSNIGNNVTYTENGSGVRLAPGLIVSDPDSPNFGGGYAVIDISSGAESTDRLVVLPTSFLTVTGSELVFAGTVVATYSGGFGATPLTISFNSLAVLSRVQHILQNVAFLSVANEPGLTPRGVNFQVSDGSGGLSGSVGKQVVVLPSNDIPVIGSIGGPVSYVENAAPVRVATEATVSDIDSANFGGGYLRVYFQTGYQAGDQLMLIAAEGVTTNFSNVLLNGTPIGTFSGGTSGTPLQVNFNSAAAPVAAQAVLRCVAFRHQGDAPSAQARILGIFVNDGDGGNSAVWSKQVNLTPVNDIPVIGGVGGLQYYKKNSAAAFISSAATLSDPDNANFAGGKLTVRITGGANIGNRLLIGGGFGIDSTGGIWWQGLKIGTRNIGGGIDYTNLEVTFNSNATGAMVQQLMRSIQFQTVRGKGTDNRVIQFQLTDGLGGISNILTKEITFRRIRS